MKQWKTMISLPHCDQVKTDLFEINTRIFQGDSPSGLLFILSLLPLTWLLKRSNLEYRMSQNINFHLLFMDDLKLYASNDQQLKRMIAIAKTFSDDIRMQFGIDKCNKITIIKGKVTLSENFTLNNGVSNYKINNEKTESTRDERILTLTHSSPKIYAVNICDSLTNHILTKNRQRHG